MVGRSADLEVDAGRGESFGQYHGLSPLVGAVSTVCQCAPLPVCPVDGGFD